MNEDSRACACARAAQYTLPDGPEKSVPIPPRPAAAPRPAVSPGREAADGLFVPPEPGVPPRPPVEPRPGTPARQAFPPRLEPLPGASAGGDAREEPAVRVSVPASADTQAARSVLSQTGLPHRWVSREEQFYRQACALAGYAGPPAPEVAFYCYYPTYDSMSAPQQRWYFYWRALIRRGVVRDTSLAYLFVYVFELLNRVGVADPEEGLARLLGLWRTYRPFHRELDRYLPAWVKSYVIFYGCAADYAERILDIDPQSGGRYLFVEMLIRLFRFRKSEHILEILDRISAYRVLRSKFVAAHRGMMEQTLCAVLLAANDDRVAHKRRSLSDRFVKLAKPARWYPFSGAVFYRPAQQAYCRGRDVRVMDCYRYFTDGQGQWYVDAPGSFYDYDRRTCVSVGWLVKSTEIALRELCGARGRLRRDGIPPELLERVRRFVTAYYDAHFASEEERRRPREEQAPARRQPPRPVHFTVDARRLEALRRESEETCALLTAGLNEEAGAAGQANMAGQTAPVGQANIAGLTDTAGEITPVGQTAAAGKIGATGQTGAAGQANMAGQTDTAGQATLSGERGRSDPTDTAREKDAPAPEHPRPVSAAPASAARAGPAPASAESPAAASAGGAPDEFSAFAEAAGPAGRQALRILLDGRNVSARLSSLARRLGMLPEPLLDGVNERALDALGDAVADAAGVFDDYRAPLSRALSRFPEGDAPGAERPAGG